MMRHKFEVAKNQRTSRANPGIKINHWIDYFVIEVENETVEVTLNDIESYQMLKLRIESYTIMCEAEDVPLNFSIKEDTNLRVIFSNDIKETLDFLKALEAFRDDDYSSALSHLQACKVIEGDKSSNLKILSTTIQSSASHSCRLFSSDKTALTPHTPPSEKSYSI